MSIALLNVAFAGHNRAGDLGDAAEAAEGLAAAFGLLCTAEAKEMRLFTGLARGDFEAARAWRRACSGPIHAVYPFLDTQPPAEIAGMASLVTRLDGEAVEAVGRNPHLAQTRWIMGAADLLVVVWNGKAGRGAGGTADAVWLALENNLPVLWYKPGDPGKLRLIRSEVMEDGFSFLEFLEQLKRDEAPLVIPAEIESLREALRGAETAPEALLELDPNTDAAPNTWLERLYRKTIWRTYANFRRWAGGRPAPSPPPVPLPEDLKAQPGFQVMQDAFAVADSRANRLSGEHRSQQLLLLSAAIVAATIGSLPDLVSEWKIGAVMAELAIGLVALFAWSAASRGARHERWGRSRRLAEQLRLERACWAIGVSTVGQRTSSVTGPASGAARDVRRRAGIATGDYTQDRVARWGGWAIDELVVSQVHYHRGQGGLNGRISARMDRVESITFLGFILVLLAFTLGWFALYFANNFTTGHMPQWIGGVVEMVGAVVPALGAASLALEATLTFGEQAERSHALAERLDAIAQQVAGEPRLDELQQAARSAIALQISQEDRWSDDTSRQGLKIG